MVELTDKYTFDTCFEEELEKEEADRKAAIAEAKIPKFLAEDVEQARQQGFADGLNKGRIEIQESLDAKVAQILNQIDAQLAAIQATHIEQVETIRDRCFITVKTVLEAVVPKYMEQSGFQEIETTLEQALEIAVHKPKVQIFVAPGNVAKLKEKIETLPSLQGEDTFIDITEDAALGEADFKLNWGKDGGAEYNASDLVRQVIESFEGHSPVPAEDLKAPEPETETPADEITPTQEAPAESVDVEATAAEKETEDTPADVEVSEAEVVDSTQEEITANDEGASTEEMSEAAAEPETNPEEIKPETDELS